MSAIRFDRFQCSHPAVHQSAMKRNESGNLSIFVVLKDSYLNDPVRYGSPDSQILARWKRVHELNQQTKGAANAAPGFHTDGWNSSYTLRPLPDSEIREWVEGHVSSIMELGPRQVYEVGCGTGLLLTRIAPRCEHYMASDFAPAVVNVLKEQLEVFPDLSERVCVREGAADDFTGIEDNSFDTVILNSVVQYFPRLAYLTKVIENAARVVKPGGHVYIGDVRSLPLLPAFAASVELFRAAPDASLEALRTGVRHRIEREKELVLSPSYFLDLPHHIARISRVEIRPARSRANNEMALYRYQVVLHVGDERSPAPLLDFIDWNDRNCNLQAIGSMLDSHPDEMLGVKHIPNGRIEMDVAVIEALNDLPILATVADVRQRVASHTAGGIRPEDLVEFAAARGFRVDISWAAARQDGSYDALLFSGHTQTPGQPPVIAWPAPESADLVRFANWPGQEKLRREQTEMLESYFKENLPTECHVDHVEIVDALTPVE